MFLLLIFLISLYLWFNCKRVYSVTLLFIIACNGLDLRFFSNTILQVHNYIFVFANLVIIKDLSSKQLQRDIKNDPILRLLSYGYLCFIVHCVMTILLGQDNLRYATGVLRVDISPLLLYFIVRKLSMREIQASFKKIGLIIIFHTILYLLQFVGINLFVEENHLDVSDTLRNGTPASLPLMILLGVFLLKDWKKTLLYALPVFAGAARGVIVALIGSIAVYYRRYILKPRYLAIMAVFAVIVGYAYTNYFQEEYQRYDVSMTEEIFKAFDLKTLMDFTAYDTGGAHYSFKENGTFAFRISMVLERLLYIIANPQYLPFGVGMIDDASPYCNFNFFIGTENEQYRYGIAQISSADIVWPSVVLRYGLFGIVFWVLLIRAFFRLFKTNKTSPWSQVGYIYSVFFILNSFGSQWVARPSWLLPFFILIAYSYQENKLSLTANASISNNSNI